MSVEELIKFLEEKCANKIETSRKNTGTKAFYHCSKKIKNLLPFQWFIDIFPTYFRYNHFWDKEEELKKAVKREKTTYLFIKKWEMSKIFIMK